MIEGAPRFIDETAHVKALNSFVIEPEGRADIIEGVRNPDAFDAIESGIVNNFVDILVEEGYTHGFVEIEKGVTLSEALKNGANNKKVLGKKDNYRVCRVSEFPQKIKSRDNVDLESAVVFSVSWDIKMSGKPKESRESICAYYLRSGLHGNELPYLCRSIISNERDGIRNKRLIQESSNNAHHLRHTRVI